MKPKSKYFFDEHGRGIYKLDYHKSQSGKYWIAYMDWVIPWVKRFIYPQTFYFKYEEQ